MLTTAPWALALAFALAAHVGWFCPGHEHGTTTRVEVVSGHTTTRAVRVEMDRSPENLRRLLGKTDRVQETFVTTHELVEMLYEDPQLVLGSGNFWEVERGIRILDTNRRGVVRRHGLRDDDVITHVMDERIHTVRELADAALRLRGEGEFHITIIRAGTTMKKHFVLQ
jgi:hypothetical protein